MNLPRINAIRIYINVIVISSLFGVIAPQTIADDYEIYAPKPADDEVNGATSHNILMIMDTSGSMDWYTAVPYTGGQYDKNEDYGNSQDRIYIYTEGRNYTGASFPKSQNACQAMTTLFNSHTTSPMLLDKTIQWHHTQTVATTQQACNNVVSAGNSVNQSKSGDRETKTIAFSVNSGSAFSIDIIANKKPTSLKVLSKIDGVADSNSDPYCNPKGDNKPAANTSYRCTGLIEAGHNKLKISFKKSNKAFTFTVTGTINSGTTEVCVDEDVPGQTSTDWKKTLLANDDPKGKIECEKDLGRHGLSDGSGDLFPTYCPFDTVCTSPNYTSSRDDSIQWANFANFADGNYHDFLQNGLNDIDINSLHEVDGSRTCFFTGHTKEINGVVYDFAEEPFLNTDNDIISVCRKRLDIMQEAATNLVIGLQESSVNIGLMRFNASGGSVLKAVQPVAQAIQGTGGKTILEDIVDLDAGGGTPLAESLHEAYLYYAGKEKIYGQTCTGGNCKYTSDPNALPNSGTYNSPIKSVCQSNNIILLTDGAPSGLDHDNDDEILTLQINKLSRPNNYTCINFADDASCLDEIAEVLAQTDVGSLATKTTVKTYTVGFDVDLDLLAQTATKGNGEYFNATSTAELQAAFDNILVDILSEASSFVAPAVSVNAFNELQHRNEIYYALFKPSNTSRWHGNIKKYTINNDGDILDVNGAQAVNSATGFFAETAKSIWSSTTDGKSVTIGGAAEQLTKNRSIYTKDVNGNLIKLSTSNMSDLDITAAGLDITDRANPSALRDKLAQWLLGKDLFDNDNDGIINEAANFIGDPLHSKPVVVTFGGNEAAPEDVLFFMSNLGMLHAIDPADNLGTELWAYLPKQHQDNIIQYTVPSPEVHKYGLDGELTVVRTEATGSTSTSFSLESLKLYFGERRGGSHYYAIDASNARINAAPPSQLNDGSSAPFSELWTITGAMHGDYAEEVISNAATSGFSDLGQTWSKMVPTKLKDNDGTTEVLIFSGGYDPRHDNRAYARPVDADGIIYTDIGNALYIVNAETGNLILSIGNGSDSRTSDSHDLNLPMADAIVATPNVIDLNGDGIVDIIYAIDILGHVWRIDIDKSKAVDDSGYLSGGLIADLSFSATETVTIDNIAITQTVPRRFYNTLDISRSDPRSGLSHLNLVVGTGYRAQPAAIEPFSNELYILFDPYIGKRSLSDEDESAGIRYNYFVNDDEAQSTRTIVYSDLIATSFDTPVSRRTAPYGIKVSFDLGEKVLQKSLTFNSKVVVSTFNPQNQVASGACGGSLGTGRIYVLDITSGLSTLREPDENGDPTIVEYLDVNHEGIAASVAIFLTPNLTVCVGPECGSANNNDDDDDDDDDDDNVIDDLADTLAEGLNTGTAYKTFWREE